MKLGLQGHTFLYSSGDFGVGGYPGDATESGCLGSDSTIFNPQFPVKYVSLVVYIRNSSNNLHIIQD